MRESVIEKAIKSFAAKRGWYVRKWAAPGRRGVPDDLFFKNGVLLIVEFKATGEKPTGLQRREHALLRKQGFEVHVIYSIADGERLILENEK